MRFSRFLDILFPVRSDEDVVRTLTTTDFLAVLEPRPVPYTAPVTTALLPFHTKEVRAALHEAKYHGNAHAFALLGTALAEYLADLDQLEARDVRVVPVPLGKERYRERGYNQVEEVAKKAGIASLSLLTRVRETDSQTSLSRAKRRENMRGAFSCLSLVDPAPLYVLVDDVVTTGATMQAAIDALSAAGARHILPLALAH